ncbi:MAG: tetratricopeptide repeat protein [Planctomycetes bacterium]|nr:tetratricopeptide repeat protein [Planctomycetota bacterium]
MVSDPHAFVDKARQLGFLDAAGYADARRAIDEAAREGRRPRVEQILLERRLLGGEEVARVLAALAAGAEATWPVGQAVGTGAAAPPAAVSEIGGKFDLRTILGRGGMGEVFLASDRLLRREVAVKTLSRPEKLTHVRRFIEEAQVTGQLEHPNIVPVYEYGVDPASRAPYLAMKRVRGTDLAQVLAGVKRGAPSESSARREPPARTLSRLLDVFLKVCDAVAYAHSRGVLHRDLKPENIMTGEFGEVLVMDWGLAKILGSSESSSGELVSTARSSDPDQPGLTADGQSPGTPRYMSPEQARGEVESLDERTDVYSLGAVLYEILSLEKPIEGKTASAIMARARKGVVRAPSRRSSAPWPIPRELEAAVLKAMASGREDRYPRVLDLKADVEAYRAGGILSAARYSPLELAAKWVRRHKSLALGSAAAVLALAAGLWAMRALERRREAGEAETLVTEGREKWSEARSAAPFNPAAPEAYFRAHITALTRTGRGLARHPKAPQEWRDEVAARALELQRSAQEAGDWPLALVLAELPHEWRATTEEESRERVGEVDAAIERAAKADRERLAEILDRIGKAEAAAAAGKKHGNIVPGEIEERARRLARASGPALTREVLTRLASPPPESGGPESRRGRLFHVELLGRKGDLATSQAGWTSPALARRALEESLDGGSVDADLLAAWIRAAARLATVVRFAARSDGSLDWLPGTLDEMWHRHGNIAPVTFEIARARRTIELLSSAKPLSPPGEDPRSREAFQQEIEDLADWAASAAGSGSAYTAALLALATAPSGLSEAQVAFVYDEIGLHGDSLPPDLERPDLAALPVLEGVCRALPGTWLPDERPPHVLQEAWTRTRAGAIAAAANLSRLGDPALAHDLYRRRFQSGQDSAFWNATRIAFALAPLEGWPEPANARDFADRGNARLDQGDLAGAIEDYTRAIEIEPGLAPAWSNRGNARIEQDDLAGAFEDYTRAIEIDPRYAIAWANRGNVRLDRRDLAGAIEDYTRALEFDPGYGLAWANRGNARLESGDAAGAIEDSTRAIELEPNLANAYINRGVARLSVGDKAGAFDDFTRAIERDPDHPGAYCNRGTLRQANWDLPGAMLDFTRAIELDPNFARAYGGRAGVRLVQKDFSGALEDHDRALALDPSLWQSWSGRGMALAPLGRTEEAERSFEEALRRCPPGEKNKVEFARKLALGR